MDFSRVAGDWTGAILRFTETFLRQRLAA
jgi:hypothetical protein